MKQRKRSRPEAGLFVELKLRCQSCKKVIGSAYRLTGEHVRAGEEIVDARCSPRYFEPENGERTLTVTCPTDGCGATPSVRWRTIADALKELDPTSNTRSSMTI